MATTKVKNWWLVLLLSVLITVLAIVVMLKPAEAYVALVFYFAFMTMFSGFFNFFFALNNRKNLDSWGWFLFLGILEIVLGIALFLQPHITALVLILYVGFWLTFKAVLSIGYSFELKKLGFRDWWLNLLGGIITLIFSFMMIINPVFGALSVVYLTGITLLLTGIFGIYLSFQLKNLETVVAKA